MAHHQQRIRVLSRKIDSACLTRRQDHHQVRAKDTQPHEQDFKTSRLQLLVASSLGPTSSSTFRIACSSNEHGDEANLDGRNNARFSAARLRGGSRDLPCGLTRSMSKGRYPNCKPGSLCLSSGLPKPDFRCVTSVTFATTSASRNGHRHRFPVGLYRASIGLQCAAEARAITRQSPRSETLRQTALWPH